MSLGLPTQFPARGSPQVAGTRTKVALKPGHSLMDWIRLGRNNPDLAGTGGRLLEVSQEELAKHNTKEDAWMALRGRVYNVTPYMDFHPGGVDELMRGAGQDGTDLFDEVHKWVNFASFLEKCLVGRLVTESSPSKAPSRKKPPPIKTNGLLTLPGPPPGPTVLTVPVKQPPRYEWYQTDDQVTLVVYTKWKDAQHEHVIVDRTDRNLLLSIQLEEHTFTVHIELENEVLDGYEVRVQRPSGKVEVSMKKGLSRQKWADIGRSLDKDKKFILTKDTEVVYRCCRLESIARVSHDTNLYCVTLPKGTRMCVPTGHHIHLKVMVEGMEVVRSYTVVRPSLDPAHQDPRVDAGAALYLMVKIYTGGALTPQLQKLNPGDPLEVSTHTGDFNADRLTACTDIILYAAGTGFTPMINLMYFTSTRNKQANKRKVHLSFFNKTQEDILWRDQLDKLTADCPSFDVRHILSQPDEKWTGPTGRVRKGLMEGSIPQTGEESTILFCACGPTAFTEEAIGLAQSLGYSKDMTHAFLG